RLSSRPSLPSTVSRWCAPGRACTSRTHSTPTASSASGPESPGSTRRPVSRATASSSVTPLAVTSPSASSVKSPSSTCHVSARRGFSRTGPCSSTLVASSEEMGQLPEHVEVNRAHWDHRAAGWVAGGEHNWALDEPVWGIWGTPESRLRLLPEDMRGIDAIELGCGTAYVCGWMARRGARVVGVDVSRGQLRTARRLAADHGVDLTLVQA